MGKPISEEGMARHREFMAACARFGSDGEAVRWFAETLGKSEHAVRSWRRKNRCNTISREDFEKARKALLKRKALPKKN